MGRDALRTQRRCPSLSIMLPGSLTASGMPLVLSLRWALLETGAHHRESARRDATEDDATPFLRALSKPWPAIEPRRGFHPTSARLLATMPPRACPGQHLRLIRASPHVVRLASARGARRTRVAQRCLIGAGRRAAETPQSAPAPPRRPASCYCAGATTARRRRAALFGGRRPRRHSRRTRDRERVVASIPRGPDDVVAGARAEPPDLVGVSHAGAVTEDKAGRRQNGNPRGVAVHIACRMASWGRLRRPRLRVPFGGVGVLPRHEPVVPPRPLMNSVSSARRSSTYDHRTSARPRRRAAAATRAPGAGKRGRRATADQIVIGRSKSTCAVINSGVECSR